MAGQELLAPTPPMGWNSWNSFEGRIDANLIMRTADAIAETGLREAGYEYVIVDDCWPLKERSSEGQLVPDPAKFPDGMKAVADYVHSKGLKFGIYSCCGTMTCAQYPGSFGHEYQDAKTFASWGVDYLKYDNCFKPQSVSGPVLYRRMGEALRSCGRPIVYAACQWGTEDVWTWIRSTGANTFRSTGDIRDCWQSIADIALSQLDKQCYACPDCFNDMDMLVVGMKGKSANAFVAAGGCTDNEYECHFALWCMMASPLILGLDVRHVSKRMLGLLTNEDLIAINQDVECRPAQVLRTGSPQQFVLAKMLHGGAMAIGFFNLSSDNAQLNVNFFDIGLPGAEEGTVSLYDCLTRESTGTAAEHLLVDVPMRSCRVFRASVS